jgi:hypothetical protein
MSTTRHDAIIQIITVNSYVWILYSHYESQAHAYEVLKQMLEGLTTSLLPLL